MLHHVAYPFYIWQEVAYALMVMSVLSIRAPHYNLCTCHHRTSKTGASELAESQINKRVRKVWQKAGEIRNDVFYCSALIVMAVILILSRFTILYSPSRTQRHLSLRIKRIVDNQRVRISSHAEQKIAGSWETFEGGVSNISDTCLLRRRLVNSSED